MRDADFVCLQEVDHFEDCYKAKLTELGFSVQYAQQPWVDGDGSLIAWNPAVWKPCTLEKLEFDRVRRQRGTGTMRSKTWTC